MNCLLDTHAFLWAAFDPDRLSRTAHAVILDRDNEIFVSAVSFWEISLKFALGKIELKGVRPEDLPAAASRMNCDLLALEAEEAASFHELPRHRHKDPFDRMLVRQVIRRRMKLISRDAALTGYAAQGLEIIW